MQFQLINGSITTPQGFSAAGIHCGIRKNKQKKDLMLIAADRLCTAAAVYTQNLVKGAPLLVTQHHLQNGTAQAVICNSGNANTCTANGEVYAKQMCQMTAQQLGIDPSDVIVASTGVIGAPFPIAPIEAHMDQLAQALDPNNASDAAEAILTTDTHRKQAAVIFEAGGKTVTIGGIAKGSGMIHPNMATLLGFLTTDLAISSELLDVALHEAVNQSFNMISVDGDTSTNDMVSILASGAAENEIITKKDDTFKLFTAALTALCVTLAKEIARDGEGATKLLVCHVQKAKDLKNAQTAAKAVICSSLVKTALFGSDANWGRVLCALGYSGAALDVSKIDLSFESSKGRIDVCQNGAGIAFCEQTAKEVLEQDEIIIDINLNDGAAHATAFGCDLTYDYVKINGDYRT